MELGLGTVQFGARYGVAHAGPRARPAEVRAILERAVQRGVRVLDTAPAYGDAEALLGSFGRLVERFDVVTKTGGDLRRSLRALGLTRVWALLEHDPARLVGPGAEAAFDALRAERDAGRAQAIGVSVYGREQLERILERFPLDVVQLPLSAVDQRMLPVLADLRGAGIEVHARSVLLQGALLAEPERLAHLPATRDAVRAFQARARRAGLTPLQAALGFARALPELDVVLVGAQSLAQLDELLAASDARVERGWFASCACDDPRAVDPSRWEEA
jgi:aryl-alcohol dehydrogenase-like predicted oxidoreductase